MADLQVEDHGTIFLLSADSPAGQEWIDNNIDSDAQTLGKKIVVGHRYINDIIDGLTADGLSLGVA